MRAAVSRPRGQATSERLEGEGKQTRGRGAEGGLGGGGHWRGSSQGEGGVARRVLGGKSGILVTRVLASAGIDTSSPTLKHQPSRAAGRVWPCE